MVRSFTSVPVGVLGWGVLGVDCGEKGHAISLFVGFVTENRMFLFHISRFRALLFHILHKWWAHYVLKTVNGGRTSVLPTKKQTALSKWKELNKRRAPSVFLWEKNKINKIAFFCFLLCSRLHTHHTRKQRDTPFSVKERSPSPCFIPCCMMDIRLKYHRHPYLLNNSLQ